MKDTEPSINLKPEGIDLANDVETLKGIEKDNLPRELGLRLRDKFPPFEVETPGYNACETCPVIRDRVIGRDGDPNGPWSGLRFFESVFLRDPKHSGVLDVARDIGGERLRDEVEKEIRYPRNRFREDFYKRTGRLPESSLPLMPEFLHGPARVLCRPIRGGEVTSWGDTDDDLRAVYDLVTIIDPNSPKKYKEFPLGPVFVPVAHKVVCPALVSGEASARDMNKRFVDALSLSLKAETAPEKDRPAKQFGIFSFLRR